ncbi:MAG: VWA domain-containing protein [Pseudomonadota bacterium]|nr:VWA domain-containing protein [Pseudomonadota bacterium]
MALADPPTIPPQPAGGGTGGGRLAENVLHSARFLRAAGLPVGPGKTLDAVRAAETVGLSRRDDFYWALHAVFVNRRDQREVFDQAFHVFWRNPRILERMMHMLLPQFQAAPDPAAEEMSRRLAEALRGPATDDGDREGDGETEMRFDAALTYSDQDVFRTMDFAKMSLAELAQAKAAIGRLRLPIRPVPTRRFRPAPRGQRVDFRASMRAAVRPGGEAAPLRFKAPRQRHPPVVAICDISGSMARYSRMLLHFMHAVASDRDRVHTFLFGTRLTNVTRYLRYRDVDEALAKVGNRVDDWSGGTRIGHCLHTFNNQWSRRVLTQGPVVLLITDGLDREAGAGLTQEMDRLHRSCRHLIWLNPLLRYDGFEPKSLGIRAILPHVDDFRPVHSLASLEQLVDVLAGPPVAGNKAIAPWLERMRETAPPNAQPESEAHQESDQ